MRIAVQEPVSRPPWNLGKEFKPDVPEFASIPSTELAWAAGFFDGEGYTGVRYKPRSCTLYVDVSQTDPRPLYRLMKAIGGKVRGPYPRVGNQKGVYRWQGGDKGTAVALARMIPYLSEPKLEQYDRAREIRALAREGFFLSKNQNIESEDQA